MLKPVKQESNEMEILLWYDFYSIAMNYLYNKKAYLEFERKIANEGKIEIIPKYHPI